MRLSIDAELWRSMRRDFAQQCRRRTAYLRKVPLKDA
jgi:hypothetical protein